MQAVIFDCDGTLVDSEPLSRMAWERCLEPYGYRVTDADLDVCLGRPFPHTHAHFSARAPLPERESFWPVFARELFDLFHSDLVPFDDAVAAARALAADGVPMAVASSSSRERLELALRLTGLLGLFPVTVAGDEVRRGKPAPDMFLAAADRLGVDPVACVAVEDTPPGVESALKAGMAVVGVARRPEDTDRLAAAHVVTRRVDAHALRQAGRRSAREGAG